MTQPVRNVDPKAMLREGGDPPSRSTMALASAIQGESRVNRLKRMFREEWEKPFWVNLRENVSRDFGYYTGSGQWDPDVLAKMQQDKKPALTFNHIRPTCQVLFGLERMNRFDPKAAPKGKEDAPVANVFTRLIREEYERTNGEYILTDGFEDGVICGVVAYALPISYMNDPINGEIEFETVRVPEELIWCTPWKRYDLWDTRGMFRHKWVDVDLLVARYPDFRAQILEGLSASMALNPRDAGHDKVRLTQNDPTDAYRADDISRAEDDRDFWFDEKNNRVRVIEAYYPTYSSTWLLTLDDGKTVVKSTEDRTIKRLLERLVANSPNRQMQLVQRNVRKIEMCVFLGATDTELESGIPFEKDDGAYPYVPFFCELKRDEVQGLVRSLRDPQDEINARRSQVAWLIKATGDGWFVDENSVVDSKKFEEESRDPKGIYHVKKNANDPRRIPPPQISPELFRVIAVAVNEIKMISGVNSDLRGERDGDPSGIAMARAQQQGQIVTTGPFDNFRLTKRLIYRKFARRIQEVYTDERVVRIFNPDNGEDEFVTINQQVPIEDEVQAAGLNQAVRYQVLNDIGTLKYDIQMVETPASPTQRDGNVRIMLEMLQKIPGVTPLIIGEIFDNMDGISDRLKRQVKKWVADSMATPEGPPPPKVNISLKGEIDPAMARDLADGALDGKSGPDAMEKMGAQLGNAQNPSGQLPTGGSDLDNNPHLAPAP